MLGARLFIRGKACDSVQLRSALAEAARIANEAIVVRDNILKNECDIMNVVPVQVARVVVRREKTSWRPYFSRSHDYAKTGP